MAETDDFDRECKDNAARMAADPDVRRATRELILASAPYKYTYNYRWLGLPIIQFPQDIVALQEIVWAVQPELIIETGVARGGSLVFYASLLQLLGGDRTVVGVELDLRQDNRAALEAHPMFSRIALVDGSSIDPAVVAKVTAIAAGRRSVLVVLDSNHTHAHVLAEMQAYAPLVTPGSYLIVLDTAIEGLPGEIFEGRPWGPGDNPRTAVDAFLATTDRFVVDSTVEDKLLITVAPGGYLRCIK